MDKQWYTLSADSPKLSRFTLKVNAPQTPTTKFKNQSKENFSFKLLRADIPDLNEQSTTEKESLNSPPLMQITNSERKIQDIATNLETKSEHDFFLVPSVENISAGLSNFKEEDSPSRAQLKRFSSSNMFSLSQQEENFSPGETPCFNLSKKDSQSCFMEYFMDEYQGEVNLPETQEANDAQEMYERFCAEREYQQLQWQKENEQQQIAFEQQMKDFLQCEESLFDNPEPLLQESVYPKTISTQTDFPPSGQIKIGKGTIYVYKKLVPERTLGQKSKKTRALRRKTERKQKKEEDNDKLRSRKLKKCIRKNLK